jgi:ATP-dependent DNA ligase
VLGRKFASLRLGFLADRFPLAVEAVPALPVRSCVIDGEAIVCDGNGLAVFGRLPEGAISAST